MKRFTLLCSLLLIFAVLLSSCAAGDMEMSAPAPVPAPTAAPADAPSAPVADMDFSEMPAQAPSAVGESSVPLPLLTPTDSRGRRLVYTVDLHIETTEFIPGIQKLVNTVNSMDGYVVTAQVQGRSLHAPEFERIATYVFNIDTERLAEFIVTMENNYNLVNLWQASDDITGRHTHGGLTLSDLREQEERLKEQLDNENLRQADRLNLENTLAEVQASIRSHEVQRSEMDYNVRYSTISVAISEVIFKEELPDLTFGERFSVAVNRSLDGFVAFLQGLVIVIISILPTLIILAVIAIITIFVIRKVKKWNETRPKKQPKKAPPIYSTHQSWNNNANWNYNNQNTSGTNQNGNDANSPNDNEPKQS